jgi:hypothetical protein
LDSRNCGLGKKWRQSGFSRNGGYMGSCVKP